MIRFGVMRVRVLLVVGAAIAASCVGAAGGPSQDPGAVLDGGPTDADAGSTANDAGNAVDAGTAAPDGGTSAPDAGTFGGDGGATGPSAGCGKRAAATGVLSRTLSGTKELYAIRIPAAYDEAIAYPVLFSFPGLGGTATDALGDNDVIAGKPSIKISTASGITDYVKAELLAVEAEFCVDTSRVFATGYSYGATVADNVACDLGDLFRGVAVWEGFGPGACPVPVAMWFNHNQNDTTVPYTWGVGMRDAWLTTDGCGTSTQPYGPSADCVEYACSKAPLVWCAPASGGHSPPAAQAPSMLRFFSEL